MEEELKLDTMTVDEVCEWLGANGLDKAYKSVSKVIGFVFTKGHG